MSDWANHLSTIFPEVRLKRYLEMRGADVGPAGRLCALPALFVGLLYDQTALDTAWDLVKGWSAEERQTLRDDAPRLGLDARIRSRTLRDIGRDVLALARTGLMRRNRLDSQGRSETRFLEPLEAFVRDGRVGAQELLAKFEGEWHGSVDPAFKEFAY